MSRWVAVLLATGRFRAAPSRLSLRRLPPGSMRKEVRFCSLGAEIRGGRGQVIAIVGEKDDDGFSI